MTTRLLAPLVLFSFVLPAAAQPAPRVPDGFRAELLLAAPDVEAPTALCVAPNGDVYFAEHAADAATNPGRISLLKGGDPKRKTRVADKLGIVLGLELVRDKLYVVHAPAVTVFTLDAEGKAKERQDLFTDLGPPAAGFDDHVAGGIRLGMDGYLYVAVGDKGIPKMARKEKDRGSLHVTEGRERRSSKGSHLSLEGGGVLRFRPDGSGLEVFASGLRNPRDVALDDHDRLFVRDQADEDGWGSRLFYVAPGGFYGYPWAFKQRSEEVLPAVHDFGKSAPASGCIYADDGLPETYFGRVFHCEWDKGRVVAVRVKPEGAAYAFGDEIAFLDAAGTGPKDFRPFSLRPTADGRGFYVTDWGFAGWQPKGKTGRLWKVTYTRNDVKPAPRGKDGDTLKQLIESLGHPAHSERLRAQRALIAKGNEAVEPLAKLFKEGTLSPPAHRHALWVLRELRWPLWPKLASQIMHEQDDSLIFNAARALATYEPKEPGSDEKMAFRIAGELITTMDGDDHPPNRLAAAVALARVSTPKWCFDVIYELGPEKDPWARFAYVRTLKRGNAWGVLAKQLPLNQFAKWDSGSRDGLFQALIDEYDAAAVEILQNLLKQDDPAYRKRAVEVLGRLLYDRKPYAGGWWGLRPGQQGPPARNMPWEAMPLIREALQQARGDKDEGVSKAAAAALREPRRD